MVHVGRRGKSSHPAFDSRDPLLDARADAELDLHGLGAIEARSAVRAFLESWRRRKAGAVVHLITGKGKGSASGPVLRGLVKTLLQGELRVLVAEWGLDDGEGGYRVRVR
jgi:DNA-nicking Smr family endonuclease